MASLVPEPCVFKFVFMCRFKHKNSMITFGQSSMNGDVWATGMPLNTELVAGCLQDNASTHLWTEWAHSWNTHALLSLPIANLLHTDNPFCNTHLYNTFLQVFSVRRHVETQSCRHISLLHFDNMQGCTVWIVSLQLPRPREVTGTTPNPRAVPMETSVAGYNEGERVMKEREKEGKGRGKSRRREGCWRKGPVGGYGGKQFHSKGQWEVWWRCGINILEHSSTPPLYFLVPSGSIHSHLSSPSGSRPIKAERKYVEIPMTVKGYETFFMDMDESSTDTQLQASVMVQ